MRRFLNDIVVPSARFSRSANVERVDDGALLGYRPTGRAVDIVSRLARGMLASDGGRALSITGPYGSGKSSLAVFVDALLRPSTDPARSLATNLLNSVSPDTAERLQLGLSILNCEEKGFIRAFTTADREPVANTVVRAAAAGANKYGDAAAAEAILKLDRSTGSLASARRVFEAICDLCTTAPVLLLIDEFGKNLETFALSSRSDADLFLLQQLAEAGQGLNALPIFTITLQHLSFDDYAATAEHSQRREWAKIQGRFEDVAYVETPDQTRTLISAALTCVGSDAEQDAIKHWSQAQVEHAHLLGLPLRNPDEVASTFPLHPATLLILPELCARFGQYQRTLFSFLTGPEPKALPAFLRETIWDSNDQLPTFQLEGAYDYFIESSRTMASVASSASRWLEIETVLRDSTGLSDMELKTAKTIAVLNLVSSGGSLRASQKLLEWVVGPGVLPALRNLESLGIVTYREFADDYRIWRGSDIDLRGSIGAARRRLTGTPIAKLLESIHPLQPVVAARHSIENHTLRVFVRKYVDRWSDRLSTAELGPGYDGVLGYLVDAEGVMPTLRAASGSRPIAIAKPRSVDGLNSAALELAAIMDVLSGTPSLSEDWVARRELNERLAAARQVLDGHLAKTFSSIASWYRLDGQLKEFESAESVSSVLSKLCSDVYSETPRIPNEMLNRTNLTSQGAKARRLLIQAMLTNPEHESLGIVGFGPERSMYDAVLKHLGMHKSVEGKFGFQVPEPRSELARAWDAIVTTLEEARHERVSVADVVCVLENPPFGMRAGVIPVVITAALIVYSDQIAIFEHGTFRPRLGIDTAERMVANPQFFELKHVASEDGARAHFLATLTQALGLEPLGPNERIPRVLAVVSHLVRKMAQLPKYARETRNVSVQALLFRKCVIEATEPDELLFNTIPIALGFPPLPAGEEGEESLLVDLVNRVRRVLAELDAAYPALLKRIRGAVISQVKVRTKLDYRSEFQTRAQLLGDSVIDPDLRSFIQGLGEASFETDEWSARIGTIVSRNPPANWTDDHWTLFEVRLRGLAAAMLRVEAIIFDPERGGGGFDAMRVTVTSANGIEGAEIVGIDHATRHAATRVLRGAAAALQEEVGGSPEQARTALLAAIASDILSKEGLDDTVIPIGQNQWSRDKGGTEIGR